MTTKKIDPTRAWEDAHGISEEMSRIAHSNTLHDLDTTGTTELRCETTDANGTKCAECGDVGPGGKLFVYSTVRGARVRIHDGQFCSKDCHDRFHGLAPR